FPARTLVYSVHKGWRRALSRSWNAALFRLLKAKSLLRISIHPPDYSQPAIWNQILGFIEATKNLRTATTYQDWIAEQRLQGGPSAAEVMPTSSRAAWRAGGRVAFPPIRFSRKLFRSKTVVRATAQTRHGLRNHHRS